MGSDCSASALENRFRRIKQDSKRINDAISRGVDPLTLGIGSFLELEADGRLAGVFSR